MLSSETAWRRKSFRLGTFLGIVLAGTLTLWGVAAHAGKAGGGGWSAKNLAFANQPVLDLLSRKGLRSPDEGNARRRGRPVPGGAAGGRRG